MDYFSLRTFAVFPSPIFTTGILLLPEGLGQFRLRGKVLQFLLGNCRGVASTVDYNCNMTLEELVACDNAAQK